MKKLIVLLALAAILTGCAHLYEGGQSLMSFDINNPAHLVASKNGKTSPNANKARINKPDEAREKVQDKPQTKPQAQAVIKAEIKPDAKPEVTHKAKDPVLTSPRDKPQAYMFHKQTGFIKVHYNLTIRNKQAVADGYVEPCGPGVCLHTVKLELVGLDEGGKIKVSVSTMIEKDPFLSMDKSPFTVSLPMQGARSFGLRGSYYHYEAGKKPDLNPASLDQIPF